MHVCHHAIQLRHTVTNRLVCVNHVQPCVKAVDQLAIQTVQSCVLVSILPSSIINDRT